MADNLNFNDYCGLCGKINSIHYVDELVYFYNRDTNDQVKINTYCKFHAEDIEKSKNHQHFIKASKERIMLLMNIS